MILACRRCLSVRIYRGWEYAGNSWVSDVIERPDPCDMPASMPAPLSPEDALCHHEETVWQQTTVTHVVPWSTMNQWEAFGDHFEVKASMINTIRQHKPGVYTFAIGGFVGGEYVPLGKYPTFHDIPVSGKN